MSQQPKKIEFDINGKKVQVFVPKPESQLSIEGLLPNEKSLPYYDLVLVRSVKETQFRYDICKILDPKDPTKKARILASIWVDK